MSRQQLSDIGAHVMAHPRSVFLHNNRSEIVYYIKTESWDINPSALFFIIYITCSVYDDSAGLL